MQKQLRLRTDEFFLNIVDRSTNFFTGLGIFARNFDYGGTK